MPDQVDRFPLESIKHLETYKDYSADTIDMIYSEKEGRTDSKQFVRENNKETLAQVFTDVRYKKADNEYFSGLFLEVLKKQGFMEK